METIEAYLAQENNNFNLEVFCTEVWIYEDEYYFDKPPIESDQVESLGVQYVAQYHMPGYLDTHGTVIADTYESAIAELSDYTEMVLMEVE